jgi:hypothetical protein
MADGKRRTYYVIVHGRPVSLAIDDVTYSEAMAVAAYCCAEGMMLFGPDEGPRGFVLNFDMVTSVEVNPDQPKQGSLSTAREKWLWHNSGIHPVIKGPVSGGQVM